MHTLIVYESMYGNTHVVADHIAEGLRRPDAEVRVLPVGEATAEEVAWADLVVVGGPTHMHGMTSQRSRESAAEAVAKSDSAMLLDPNAQGPGLRDWFGSLAPGTQKRAAAFDTRFDGPGLVTGHASHGIEHRLRKHGFTMVTKPESFLVDKHTDLIAGEAERATVWGAHLGESYAWPPVASEPDFHEGVGRTP